ncbi:unnamed protein product, partial [Polarella glacialis]
KVLLWTATLKIVLLLWAFGASEDEKDTMPTTLLLIPITVLTFVFGVYSLEDHGLLVEVSWIFSTYLESIAMLPQYIYCFRNSENKCRLVTAYVFAMGGYQMIFGLSWMYHFVMGINPYDLDVSSMISGILGILFFSDYLKFKMSKKSMLWSVCLSLDDTIREAQDAALEAVYGPGAETVGREMSHDEGVELSAEVVLH